MLPADFNPAIEQDFIDKRIDRELSISILERYNRGEFDRFTLPKATGFPQIDGERIIDTTKNLTYSLPYKTAVERVEGLGGKALIDATGLRNGTTVTFSEKELRRLGLQLLPFTAYGILNGGSATSYVDEKKNLNFNETLFRMNRSLFKTYAFKSKGRPKGVTAGFIQPDGGEGPSFLELKMRSLLIQALRYMQHAGLIDNTKNGAVNDTSQADYLSHISRPSPLPLFQMSSVYNTELLQDTYIKYAESEMLRDLIDFTGIQVTDVLTGIQPLITAYTHSSEGTPKGIYTHAWGKENNLLPLPGGHGQNFMALRDIYLQLYKEGYRYAYLGNVDNLGNSADPKSIALTALSGCNGSFEFSFKTPVDVKGGVLIKDSEGRLNAVDIGPAVSKEEVAEAEQTGKPILFNCATGLFNLSYLAEKIDSIIQNLPTRFSDQDKDAGKYSQAEQITWEIIGMMEDPLILGVDKTKRFLASKLFLENLLTSGIGIDSPEYPSELRPLAVSLNKGLENLLHDTYGMKFERGKWIPKSIEELLE
ncbi:MAG: UTP--glucose-1-phosphate uridylyltransferase [Spirochaetia bacterium]